MTSPNIFKVNASLGKGALYVMPKPDHQFLDAHIQHLKSLGITKVVSLLEEHEITALGLNEEPNLCKAHEIDFMNIPFKDRDVPPLAIIQTLVPQLLNEILDGHQIAIHCHGGVGRTGILANCLLIESGVTASQALTLISEARQCPSPNIDTQIEFIRLYELKKEPSEETATTE